jgi:hypothetical protein
MLTGGKRERGKEEEENPLTPLLLHGILYAGW